METKAHDHCPRRRAARSNHHSDMVVGVGHRYPECSSITALNCECCMPAELTVPDMAVSYVYVFNVV